MQLNIGIRLSQNETVVLCDLVWFGIMAYQPL